MDDTLYVILLHNNPGKHKTGPLVHDHVLHLVELEQQGQLVLCGPFGDYPGGMVIVRAESYEAAKEIAECDPFVKSGVESYELRTWGLSHQGNKHLGVLE